MYLQQCVSLGIYRLFKTAHMHMKKLYNSSIMAQNKYFGKPSGALDYKRFTS